MVIHTQTVRRQQPTNCLSLFDNFVKLALKGLRLIQEDTEAKPRTLSGVLSYFYTVNQWKFLNDYISNWHHDYPLPFPPSIHSTHEHKMQTTHMSWKQTTPLVTIFRIKVLIFYRNYRISLKKKHVFLIDLAGIYLILKTIDSIHFQLIKGDIVTS